MAEGLIGHGMRILVIADVFPPLRISGAVQLRDLSLELVRQGHQPTVLTPVHETDESWQVEMWEGVRIVRLKTPKFRDVGYFRRTAGEFAMPWFMLHNFRKSPIAREKFDGIVWYSPSIFLGPIVRALKHANRCRSYLIVRDIFPEWVADLGLIGRGLPYRVFKLVERYLYSVADIIGVQTAANLPYFSRWAKKPRRRVEVLHNWLAEAPIAHCSITVAQTTLAGRKIFLYIGNMGVAQGMGALIDLVESMKDRDDVGFLFVGRGSNAQALRNDCKARGLDNVVFFDEIDPSEIPGLCAQAHVGLVALDWRHHTHNIPGKFVTCMRTGLPVLANINPGNDLVDLINREGVGRASTARSVTELRRLADELLVQIEKDPEIRVRCKRLATGLFSPEIAARQVVEAVAASDR